TDVAATEPEVAAEEAAAAAPETTATAGDSKPATEAKAKKAAAPRKARSTATHPPYAEMISEAIATLKERTGSSQYAIGKFLEDKHK
nr:histone H1/H5 family protein [Shewanella shenzhenensis]